MGRLLVVVVAAAVFAGPAAAALPRSAVDRPDEVAGPQIHAVYALPSDGADRGLDATGAIENSVALFRGWLAAETGGATLRFDTATRGRRATGTVSATVSGRVLRRSFSAVVR